ncbi:hypothetical protein HWV07_00840 [Natronomonas salina]|uniref:hypothetical protein n=1 Tax=Natronomonas salina TaxID=1710540 RepID=UPI0015B70B6E|nr:hypothetical protein [Natronomonas salina]QLD87657.1 hypothetical protein HWV07_00840 [Natronomonas salina]
MLKLLGAAAGAATFGSVVHAQESDSDPEPSFVLEQGDECVELTPMTGEQPVEELYDYRYPTDDYDSVSGSDGDSYSSHGTTHLQRDATSILFLYDGPEGLSLVVVHGKFQGDDNGGIVSFTFEGMPEDASWFVKDDYYAEDGDPAVTNYDQWDGDGTDHQVDWAYAAGRTDGGAARDLGEEFEFSITPAFNEEAILDVDLSDGGPIEAWEALSADGDSPERVSLEMGAPVTIRTGTCEESTDDEPEEEPDDDEPEDGTGDEPEDEPEDDPDDGTEDEPSDEPDGEDGTDEDEPDDKDGEKDKEKEDSEDGC